MVKKKKGFHSLPRICKLQLVNQIWLKGREVKRIKMKYVYVDSPPINVFIIYITDIFIEDKNNRLFGTPPKIRIFMFL